MHEAEDLLTRHQRALFPGGNVEGLENFFWIALWRLLREDRVLFRYNVSEQTLAARLAMYLEELTRAVLPHHRADIEYNRTLGRPKMIGHRIPCDCREREWDTPTGRRIRHARNHALRDGAADYRNVARWNDAFDECHDRVTPDVVLHSRGELAQLDENKIVIELKKTDRSLFDCNWDRCRLRRMTMPSNDPEPSPLDYAYGFFVCFRGSATQRERQLNVRPFDAGRVMRFPRRRGWGYVETFRGGETVDVVAIPIAAP